MGPCGKDVIHANPAVVVTIPEVTAIKLTLDTNTIVCSTDPLAKAPVSIPTIAKMKVDVTFSNQVSRDFSTDDRLVVTFNDSSLAVLHDKHYIRPPLNKDACDFTPGVVAITVSLGDYAKDKFGRARLKVDEFSALELSSSAYPTCNTKACADKTTLFRLPRGSGDGMSKSPIFQQVKLSLHASTKLGPKIPMRLGSSVEAKIDNRMRL